MSITLEEALKLAENHIVKPKRETIPLTQAIGRVLAEDLYASFAYPPFDRSPFDGYAVRSEDFLEEKSEYELKVVGKLYAGMAADFCLKKGEVARIMTGAMLPEGADAIIMQEKSDFGEEVVKLFTSVGHNQNVVLKGEDFNAGELLIKKDSVIDAAALSIAAAAGNFELTVYKKPKVALISTGDELVALGKPLEKGKIYDSNFAYILGRLTQWNVELVSAERVADDAEVISTKLEKALKAADLVITTGGVSVGQKDLLPIVVEKLGADVLFHGIAVKPGMPTMLSVIGGKPVLSLSGNPFASAVLLELLGKVLLNMPLERRKAVLKTPFTKRLPVRRFLRGIYDGESVILPEGHNNSQMRSMIGCNCLLDAPKSENGLEVGHEYEIVLL